MKCYDFNKTRLHSHMYSHMSIIEISHKKKVKKRNMQEKDTRKSPIKKTKTIEHVEIVIKQERIKFKSWIRYHLNLNFFIIIPKWLIL